MPLGEPLSGFFTDEYERAMRGLDGLQGIPRERGGLPPELQQLPPRAQQAIERARLRRAMQRDQENAARPRVVEIPGWSDVLHVQARLPITAEQAAEYWRSTRRGFQPNLPPEVIHEMQRRQARRDAMGRAAQPEFDRSWGSVMTAIDNVQDLLSSVAVLGRIALTVGPRIGLRMIPGLGQLVLAAEVLTYAMQLGQLAFPAWVAICAGLKPAARAAAGTLLTMAAFKGSTGLAARASAKSIFYGIKGPGPLRWAQAAIGSALVLGQSADGLFGYGISLGPIVGYTMGAAYTAEAVARGEPVEFRRSPSAEHFGPRIKDRLAALPTSALYDRINAADVWAHAPLILAEGSPATDQERLEALVAMLAATGVLWQDWKGSGWQEDAPRLTGWMPELVPAAIERPGWAEVSDMVAPLEALEWPRGWGGRQYDLARAAATMPTAVAAALARLQQSPRDALEQSFIGVATVDAAEGLWRLILDDADGLRPHFTPGWLAMERATALGIVFTPTDDLEGFQRFWNTALERIEANKHGMQTLAEWEQLAQKHSIGWIRPGKAELIED